MEFRWVVGGYWANVLSGAHANAYLVPTEYTLSLVALYWPSCLPIANLQYFDWESSQWSLDGLLEGIGPMYCQLPMLMHI